MKPISKAEKTEDDKFIGIERITHVSDEAGGRVHWESIGTIIPLFRQDRFKGCPKFILEKDPERCTPVPGFGRSKRCPNTNQGCQQYYNYQRFLLCYNKWEHLGNDEAVEKCNFFLRGVSLKPLEFWETQRETGQWIGIVSNYKPPTDDEDEE